MEDGDTSAPQCPDWLIGNGLKGDAVVPPNYRYSGDPAEIQFITSADPVSSVGSGSGSSSTGGGEAGGEEELSLAMVDMFQGLDGYGCREEGTDSPPCPGGPDARQPRYLDGSYTSGEPLTDLLTD